MTLKLTQQRDVSAERNQHRRRFLQLGFGAAASLAMPSAFANVITSPERKLSLLNLHTGENINATYWAEGQYQTSELHAINQVLRDHRTGDVMDMDSNLIELLNILHHKMDGQQAFHVISGYRSPKTNAMLNKKSSGVAKKSLHMQGRAIDIRLPGRQLASLQQAAIQLHAGGVGYYSRSGFIHLDTGRVRSWGS
ncbi:hypothetical protein A9Q79_07415 [Methylophaga sp. 42_25_T18]|nr:hypothetical protein A9Q79_07415 [Methylophaga sp. 42_25_T18]OUR88727.1 hypothetical protein A9Q92_02495 [Methylophaga sp. 42_8_T64]